MTLQQRAIDIIGRLPEDKIVQVVQFAEFLSFDVKSQTTKPYYKKGVENGQIRKPGILKGKVKMSDDFDETPECFKEYV